MTREELNYYISQLSHNLYGFAFRILRNQVEAEDAVQEIFIKLWKMGDKLKEYNSVEALATTMIRNYSIDQLRKQKHIFMTMPDYKDLDNATSTSPYDLMEQRESGDIIMSIIENLPSAYREIIQLRDIEGLSYEDIADKTNQNINTLRVTLSRARGLLRDEYKKYFNEKRGIDQVTRKLL